MAGIEDMKPGARRPRDLALLLLAASGRPPRPRARDQQADRAGGEIRRRVLDRIIALDPDPEDLEHALAAVILELGEPTGPTRGVGSMILQEWEESQAAPGFWDWVLTEAVEQGQERRGRGKDRAHP